MLARALREGRRLQDRTPEASLALLRRATRAGRTDDAFARLRGVVSRMIRKTFFLPARRGGTLEWCRRRGPFGNARVLQISPRRRSSTRSSKRALKSGRLRSRTMRPSHSCRAAPVASARQTRGGPASPRAVFWDTLVPLENWVVGGVFARFRDVGSFDGCTLPERSRVFRWDTHDPGPPLASRDTPALGSNSRVRIEILSLGVGVGDARFRRADPPLGTFLALSLSLSKTRTDAWGGKRTRSRVSFRVGVILELSPSI